MGTAFLGEPLPHLKEWIRKHHKQSQFKFLYKKAGDTDWQEYEPTEDDFDFADGKATITATGFRQIDGFDDVREVKLPNRWNSNGTYVDVASIGNDTFHDCSGLTNVVIPDGVTNIGGSVFLGCTSLTSMTIPDSVNNIGGSAFSGCSGLTNVAIGNGVVNIRPYAFSNCSRLANVTIPANTTNIGNSAFQNCSRLPSCRIDMEWTSC